jgi:ADP-ribose pyrophosphatase YjhB (NUDIX family)
LLEKKSGGWCFPGGIVMEQETEEEASVRDTYGLTGFEVEIIKKLGVERETFWSTDHHQPIVNETVYFLARPVGPTEIQIPVDEYKRGIWISTDKAFKLVNGDLQQLFSVLKASLI